MWWWVWWVSAGFSRCALVWWVNFFRGCFGGGLFFAVNCAIFHGGCWFVWEVAGFLGWFFGFWGLGFWFFEVFFEGFPVEFCPSFGEFVGLFCWDVGLC